jgi:hypothetical protein
LNGGNGPRLVIRQYIIMHIKVLNGACGPWLAHIPSIWRNDQNVNVMLALNIIDCIKITYTFILQLA